MAITLVQNQSASGASVTSVTVTLGSPTTPGNFLLAGIGMSPGAVVASITDSSHNRWIQSSYSSSGGGDCEIWFARAIQGGSASVSVTVKLAASSSSSSGTYDGPNPYDAIFTYDGADTGGASISAAGINISEWSGVWFQSPLDQWSQTFNNSASVIAPQTITPRTTGDLVVAVTASSTSVSGPSSPFTSLSMGSNPEFALAYEILSGSTADNLQWTTGSAAMWATAEASFVAGPAGINPLLQFPECLVQLGMAEDYQAPLNGIGIWTDISSYVRSMTLGPLGRQHELDRVQSTQVSVVVNNRDGSFNSWNTGSFLYPNGLDPMTPIKVTAAWLGITYPEAFAYVQSITPNISDVLNVDATIDAYDIFQMLNLAYLSNNSYAQAVLTGQ